MYAAQRNANAKVIAAFVAAGASVDQRTPDGLTALMIAARDSVSPDVVIALLGAGADGLLKTGDGKTAYDLATGNAKIKGTAAYKALDKARTPPPPPAESKTPAGSSTAPAPSKP
jgi:ankyrin repeat protein